MDIFAIGALVSAVACICVAMLLDGGSLVALLQLPAFIMVIGGTISAVLLQTPFKIFISGLKMMSWVFFPPKDNAEEVLADQRDIVLSEEDAMRFLDALEAPDPDTVARLRELRDRA